MDAGDEIIQINGQTVAGWELSKVAQRLSNNRASELVGKSSIFWHPTLASGSKTQCKARIRGKEVLVRISLIASTNLVGIYKDTCHLCSTACTKLLVIFWQQQTWLDFYS